MFFQIKSEIDKTFPTCIKLTDNLWLNADAGWKVFYLDEAAVIFKGYLDDTEPTVEVLTEIASSSTPTLYGNFIALVVKDGAVTIQHDVYRSFPLYVDDTNKVIHNLNLPSTHRVPSAYILTVSDSFGLSYVQFDPIGEVNLDPITKDEAIAEIDKILLTRFSSFFAHNTLPAKIFISGGIDTLMCWSYLKKLNIDYEIVSAENINHTQFVENKLSDIRTYWAYNQIHSWETPAVLVSGAMGDEVFLRGPLAGNIWLQQFGTSYPAELRPEHYHYHYHSLPKNQKYYGPEATASKQAAVSKILDLTINDHQHWHLDTTLTFTPFKDIRITKLLLRLSFDDVVGQLVDAEIGRALVGKNFPALLRHLQPQKNKAKNEDINFAAFLDDK